MYRNRRPKNRRERRKVSRRTRQRREGTERTLFIILGIFVAAALVLVILLAFAVPG